MFGDSFILGSASVVIDAKGRIVLPKFTYIEVDDELIFSKIEENTCFTVFSKNQILKKISILISKQEKVKTKQEYKFLQEQIDKIQNCCFGISKADKQHRVLIPSSLRESLLLKNEIYIKGGIVLQTPCIHAYNDKALVK